jgi:hypothetical protein
VHISLSVDQDMVSLPSSNIRLAICVTLDQFSELQPSQVMPDSQFGLDSRPIPRAAHSKEIRTELEGDERGFEGQVSFPEPEIIIRELAVLLFDPPMRTKLRRDRTLFAVDEIQSGRRAASAPDTLRKASEPRRSNVV